MALAASTFCFRLIRSVLTVVLLTAPALRGLGSTTPVWQQMSEEEFARLPELGRPLEFGSYNRALLAAAIFHETNRVRHQLGLRRFRHRSKLDEAADIQAGIGAMLTGADHHNPFPALAETRDRVRAVGLEYERVAENIALTMTLDVEGLGENVRVKGAGAKREFLNPQTGRPIAPLTYAGFAVAVVKQWMASPGHRANIVDPAMRDLGCSAHWRKDYSGFDTIYSVQVFLSPPP